MKDKAVIDILICVMEGLIEEIEGQGGNMVTTDDLRKFIHNMEHGISVEGKKYSGDIGK